MPRKKQEIEVQAEVPQESAVVPQPTSQARQRAAPTTGRDDDLLTISDQERGITPEDSDDVKWNFMAGAARRRTILTGVVAGLEDMHTYNPICVVDFEGVRVIIPAREMFVRNWPEGDEIPIENSIMLGRMLGATIDFILVGVDIRNRAAVASRRAAMLQRQARFYDSGRVKPGIRVACRVIGVGNNRVTVEAVGVDSVISANALSWEWFPDVTDLYSTGDLVVARVLSILKDDETGEYAVRLSVKAATENPDLPALKKLVPGCNYYGVVTGVHDRLIFVRLQTGANAKTKLYYSRQIPSKLDTVSFQVRAIDEDTGVALGLITRIVRRHARLR